MKPLSLILISILLLLVYHSKCLSANNKNVAVDTYRTRQTANYQSTNLFAKRINETLPEPQASLLNGMLFGTNSSMPADFLAKLKITGVMHVIALSGQNISILINVIFAAFIPIIGRRRACILSILFISLFIAYVGPSASVVRAGIMGSLALLASYFGRQYYGLLGLLITSIIMVGFNPQIVSDIGFQLSALATLGIMTLGRIPRHPEPSQRHSERSEESLLQSQKRWGSFVTPLLRMTKDNLRITMAALIMTLPITVINFGQLSIISPITNLLIAPVIPIITSWGFIASIVLAVIKPLGVIFLWIIWVFLSYFVIVIKLMSQIPMAMIVMPKIGWGIGGVYYLIVVLLYLRKKVRIKF